MSHARKPETYQETAAPVELDPDVDPWERQPRETPPAFDAFAVYRDMGHERSSRKTAKKIRKNPNLIHRWSRRWRWVERARAWDLRQDARRREETAQALTDMHERHARIAAAFTGKLIERLRTLSLNELSPSQMAQWFDVAVRVERVARGDVSDRASMEHSGPGGDPISVQVAEFSKMDPERRRAVAVQLAEAVRRRAVAAAGLDDDDGHDPDRGG